MSIFHDYNNIYNKKKHYKYFQLNQRLNNVIIKV